MKDETAIYATGVDLKVYKKFQSLIREKHGKLRGVLGDELTKALRLFIDAHTHNEELIPADGGSPTIVTHDRSTKLGRILDELHNDDFYPHVPGFRVNRIIADIVCRSGVYNRRSCQKYWDALFDGKHIQKIEVINWPNRGKTNLYEVLS